LRSLRYTPKEPLAEFVDCLWHFKGRRLQRELALPTGTVELVINLREEAIRVYSEVADTEGQCFSDAVVSGTQSRYMVLGACEEGSVIGVHFRPGGAGTFLGMPLSELAERHVALEDVWGAEARELHERLLEAESPAAAFALLERALISRLRGARSRHPAVGFALRRFAAEPEVGRVGEVADATGYSAKRFIRLFTDGVGLSPKRFCRVLRLQAVLNRLAAGQRVEWAEVAAAGGYCDQSHLIREFRAMTGITPGEYRPVDANSPNHVAVEE
jgi:AraC-like DNA-binding protein